MIGAGMADGRLAQVLLLFPTADKGLVQLYRKMKAALIEKYGEPTAKVELFILPFRGGDGKEEAAFPQDSAAFTAEWRLKEVKNSDRLVLEINPTPVVTIRYTSPAWEVEQQRRLAAGKKDL